MSDVVSHISCTCKVEWRSCILQVGLRGAVEPELVMEVELSSWSWYPRRLRAEACRGTDLFSGLHDPPSCRKKKQTTDKDKEDPPEKQKLAVKENASKKGILRMMLTFCMDAHRRPAAPALPTFDLSLSATQGSLEAPRVVDVYLMRLSLWIWRWGSLLMASEGIGIETV